MGILSEKIEKSLYRCPVCNAKLAIEPPRPPHDAPCSACGHPLWCRKRLVEDVVVLDVMRGRTPEHTDAVRLAKSLVGREGIPRVVVDLSELDFVTSAFVARLVDLNKRIRAAKGKLVLCGMDHLLVWDAFYSTNLYKIFDISENEEAALASL
ncbi:MAG: STAS domain-containing protein [Planctomycetes bacterium]|nr:STAS domain-containing protein [Planctomycetota bacterium]